ncbi:hypothetical protein [Pseudomonas sp. DWRC2-2]|uniref:hypothetical protein n=1 Tax=Pseudomonas sp. DWRC2-2 TaxID=2804567 RepID=UPI003CF6B1E0
MISEFQARAITQLDVGDYNAEALQPESVVLTSKVGLYSAHTYRWDVGAFCYTSRDSRSQRCGGVKVDPASFDVRRRDFVRKLIERFREGNPNTVEGNFRDVRRFMNWMDSKYDVSQIHDCTLLKAAYQNYTSDLLREMHVSGIAGAPLSQETARSYQRGARLTLSVAFDLDDVQLRRLAAFIGRRKLSRGDFVIGTSSDDKAVMFAALVNFIDEVHRVIVLDGALPVKLVSEKDKDYYYYSSSQAGLSSEVSGTIYDILNELSEFPSRRSVLLRLKTVDESVRERNAYWNARASFKNFRSDIECPAARALANKAMVAALICFVSASGQNLSVCRDLKLTTEQVVPSTQGRRFSGTKGRADGKEVYPEFGVEFAPLYKKILSIRQFMVQQQETDLVFPVFSKKAELVNIQNININGLKRFFSNSLPNLSWVTPKEWRQNVSSEYLKLSGGDTHLVAEKLGNTEGVVRAHYGRSSFEDSADQLNSFFNALHQSALIRTRSQATIPVQLIDDTVSSHSVPAGQCVNSDDNAPDLAEGFTPLAPLPSCKDPETCLFCAHYGVHADEHDIRRLLSLKFIINETKARRSSESFNNRFVPMLHRVEEVLEAIVSKNPTMVELIENVSKGIDHGDLDSFWGVHFDTLVSIGVVS